MTSSADVERHIAQYRRYLRATPLLRAATQIVEVTAARGRLGRLLSEFVAVGGDADTLALLVELGDRMDTDGGRVETAAAVATLIFTLATIKAGTMWQWVGASPANHGQEVEVVGVTNTGQVMFADGDMRHETPRDFFLSHYQLIPDGKPAD